MTSHVRSPKRLLLTAALLAPATMLGADTGEYVLIRDRLSTQRIRLVEVTDESLVHLDNGLWVSVDLADCVALFDTSERPAFVAEGVLVLSDGQRFPGAPVSKLDDTSHDDILSWVHRWLGRIDVPLDEIDAVVFRPGATLPDPGDLDTLQLANGDRFDGFIVSLDDPVVIEVEREGITELLEVARSSVSAVKMVSPARHAAGRRVWFDDTTVLDATSIQIGDDGFVRLTSMWHSAGTKPAVVKLSTLDAILLAADRLLPLATLKPDRIEGPRTRYTLPEPVTLAPDTALKLSPIEIQGPVVLRYILPPGCERFACEAYLPTGSRHWADFDLVLSSNDEEIFRTRMNRDEPIVEINVPLQGAELTIELTEGAHGSVQDRVILDFPMLLLGDR